MTWPAFAFSHISHRTRYLSGGLEGHFSFCLLDSLVTGDFGEINFAFCRHPPSDMSISSSWQLLEDHPLFQKILGVRHIRSPRSTLWRMDVVARPIHQEDGQLRL